MPCKTYKIGVFFDGTGNNAKFDSSDGRDQQSNIAKLYKLYKTGDFECAESGCSVTADSHYENGIGTYDTQKEHDAHPIQRKYDKGGGGGGAKRINAAIESLTRLLDGHPYHKSDDTKYSKRLIDVFGFSRGAAEARDFVNTFMDYQINLKKKYQDVTFNFIGVYDTVGSFGEPGNDADFKPREEFEGTRRMKESYGQGSADEVYLPHGMQVWDENYGIRDPKKGEKVSFPLEYIMGKRAAEAKVDKYRAQGWDEVSIKSRGRGLYELVGKKDVLGDSGVFTEYNFNLCMQSAKTIVHMTAHDEVRKNFPLTNIEGSGGLETIMLGVHSDVGGGYAPEKMERHKFSYVGHFRGIKAAAQAHANRLSHSVTGLWSVDYVASTRAGRGYYILARKVLNDLSNVTLNLMYEEAVKAKVAFEPLPDDENHAILPHIKAYYAYAKEHLKSAYKYAQTQDGQLLDATQRHHSSVDPAGRSTHYVGNTKLIDDAYSKDSADGGGNDARYVDTRGNQVDGREKPERADHVERAIFPNIPKKAVKPKG